MLYIPAKFSPSPPPPTFLVYSCQYISLGTIVKFATKATMPSPRNLKIPSGKATLQDLSLKDPKHHPSRGDSTQEQLPPQSRIIQTQSGTGPSWNAQQQTEALASAGRRLQADASSPQSKADSSRHAARGSHPGEEQLKPIRRQQTRQGRSLVAENPRKSTSSSQKERRLATMERQRIETNQEVAATTKRLGELSDQVAETDRQVAEADRKVDEAGRQMVDTNLQFGDLTRVKVRKERQPALEGLDQRWIKRSDKIEDLAQRIRREIEHGRPKGSFSAKDQKIIDLATQIIAEVQAERERGVEEFV